MGSTCSRGKAQWEGGCLCSDQYTATEILKASTLGDISTMNHYTFINSILKIKTHIFNNAFHNIKT